MDMMKGTIGVVVIALLAGAVWVILELSSEDAGQSAGFEGLGADSVVDSKTEARIEDLETHVDRLSAELEWMSNELSMLQSQSRESLSLKEEILEVESQPSDQSVNPRWYLEQYVKSFEGGGRGSEYFRLAVEAYAYRLLKEIDQLVSRPGTESILRQRLIGILGDPRFKENGYVIGILAKLIAESSEDTIVGLALKSLGRIGGEMAALALERVVWSIENSKFRIEAYRQIVRSLGSKANPAIVRLLSSARIESDQIYLVSLIQQSDMAAALEAFRLATRLDQPVRLYAAKAIGKFRSDEFMSFIDQWLTFETDSAVRTQLERAKKTQATAPSWSAKKMIGPPDAVPANRDHYNAWASKERDMGLQWVRLTYPKPMRVNLIHIFEVNVPGAVKEVLGIESSGTKHRLWSGTDPTTQAGVFEIRVSTTPYRVQQVQIVLDTNRKTGWNEIDAVEIVGPDGRAWASDAQASSSYSRR